ncbi:MAG TPA: 50S ribosomal protein L21 [Desulfosalsimonadaceae bacterium]|nr:50S ribosomal protein L21 [Desulfosalsimonadaceae bacterium]
MYAVIATGGKQYRVKEGEVLRIEKMPGNVGESLAFDKVLLLSDGNELTIGEPTVPNASVNARIVEQGKGKKVLVFKYKRRKRSRSKQGHRQPFTAVQIDSISQ